VSKDPVDRRIDVKDVVNMLFLPEISKLLAWLIRTARIFQLLASCCGGGDYFTVTGMVKGRVLTAPLVGSVA
jgi:hypothetical protein